MHATTSIVSALAIAGLVTSCGGAAKPTSIVGNTGAAGMMPAAGMHGCQFVADGVAYGPHRCDVAPGRLDKLSGMETFAGTLTPAGDGVQLSATLDCGPMATACGQTFTVALRREGDTWRGPVTASDSGWFLAGSTFEITDAAGYGGAGYGGAGYGGYGYGGYGYGGYGYGGGGYGGGGYGGW
ncbi:MAG: hypothetical protein R3B06_15525 [Kofleriaceae bacterium]